MSQIDNLYARARRALATGEAAQWEAAEAMAELEKLGESQRRIAEKLGCSTMTVSRYLGVIRVSSGYKNRPTFSEAMAKIRPEGSGQVTIPKAPEARAELVAELLKDKAVADAPVVRKVEDRHADRRLRAETAAWNREHDNPTRTETDRDRRLRSVVVHRDFWTDLLIAMQVATRRLTDATGEVQRSGMPKGQSGEIIRAARNLTKAADRFETAITDAGIGQAM